LIRSNKLTIIIPIYRTSKSCIDYLFSVWKLSYQSFNKIDFILSLNSVEDFNTDNEILKESNVRYFIHSTTLSIGENWVSCIEKVKTPYFKINSSNDPINIEEIIIALDIDQNYDLIIGKTEFYNLGKEWPSQVNDFRQHLIFIKDSNYFFKHIIWRNYLGDISGYIFKTDNIKEVIRKRRSVHLNSVHNYPDYSLIVFSLISCKNIYFSDKNIGHYVADVESPVKATGQTKLLFYSEYETFRLTNFLFNRYSEERQLFKLNFWRFLLVFFKLLKNS
jgi:hypothetical protein